MKTKLLPILRYIGFRQLTLRLPFQVPELLMLIPKPDGQYLMKCIVKGAELPLAHPQRQTDLLRR